MPVSENKVDEQKQEAKFDKSDVQVIDKVNTKNNQINVGDIITCSSSKIKLQNKLYLLVSKLNYLKGSPYIAIISLTAEKESYTFPGDLLFNLYSSKKALLKNLNTVFSQIEKEPYVTIPNKNTKKSHNKFKQGDILECWNDKEKQYLLVAQVVDEYQAIPLNTTKYAKAGNNDLTKAGIAINSIPTLSMLSKTLRFTFGHIKKPHYISIK